MLPLFITNVHASCPSSIESYSLKMYSFKLQKLNEYNRVICKVSQPGTKMPILVEIQGKMWKNAKCLEMGR
jgi:hypothetical protein